VSSSVLIESHLPLAGTLAEVFTLANAAKVSRFDSVKGKHHASGYCEV
jgi:hypothetical protein